VPWGVAPIVGSLEKEPGGWDLHASPASTATGPFLMVGKARHPEDGADACVALVWVLYRAGLQFPFALRGPTPDREVSALQNSEIVAGTPAVRQVAGFIWLLPPYEWNRWLLP